MVKSVSQLNQSERERYDWRDAELRKMRRIATALLLMMAVLFVVGHQLERQLHPHWAFLTAFAEAGMVGGLADWFAVTALFRYPLGIPIPHTAIIPNNKERIGRTLAAFLRSNFLTTRIVARRVGKMDVAGAMGRFLTVPGDGEGRMRMGASRLLGDMIEALDDERMGNVAKGAIRTQLEKLDVAPLLGQLLTAMIAERRHVPLLDGIVEWASKTLEANEQTIRQMVEERAGTIMRWTGLDDRLANAIVSGLEKMLADMAADPEHQLRAKGEEGPRSARAQIAARQGAAGEGQSLEAVSCSKIPQLRKMDRRTMGSGPRCPAQGSAQSRRRAGRKFRRGVDQAGRDLAGR
jgi:uncharacterized membrane-anchored protein YjiN (DUF445 family)